jgi:hypothetical protein
MSRRVGCTDRDVQCAATVLMVTDLAMDDRGTDAGKRQLTARKSVRLQFAQGEHALEMSAARPWAVHSTNQVAYPSDDAILE